MKFQSNSIFNGTITANSVADAGTNTDKFLVLNSSGVVTYRTAAELYADLGVGASSAAYTSLLKHPVKAGEAINKGQAVYVSSANGTNMIVTKASNATEATSSKTIGLLETTLALNGIGNVVTEGLLAGLDTTGATNAGDPVWLGTSGNLIYGLANKPYAPAHLVFIGIVTRINANNGEIFVKVQNGFELREIHDVDLITTTPVNGHILGYNGTLWVNKTIAGWLGFTPVTNARTLTINGTGYDLSADRSWTINSMVYPGAGIAVSTGTAWGTSITNNSANWDTAYTNRITSLTVTGSSGAATLVSNVLNIPTYTLTGLGGVATTRTLTINGTAYDLSADRSWTIDSTSASTRTIQKFTATSGQTTFTITGGYTVGMVDVYMNGVKLDNATDFTASNGTTVVLTGGALLNSVIEVYKFGSQFIPNNALRVVTSFTATAAQTTFTVNYSVGLIDVFYNGSNLAQSEYTATNGTSIILATACQLNDIVVVYAYSYSVGAYSGIGGSGTTNYISKFTGASTIGNSLIYDNGSNAIGLGVTPSAWISTSKAFQIGNTASLIAPSNEAILGNNIFVDSTDNNKYITTNFASQYRQVNGQHIFYNAPSGTAGNTISFTNVFSIANSGAATFAGSGNGIPLIIQDISAAITAQTAGYIGMSTSAFSGNNGDLVLYPRTSAASNILLMGGNVGIGLTSPGAKLDILVATNNKIQFGTGLSGSSGQYVGGFYYSSNKLSIQSFLVGSGYQPLLLQPDGGQVGIGTSTPVNASLHIANPISSETIRNQDNSAYNTFYNNAGTVRTGYIQFNASAISTIAVDIAQGLSFNTSGTERMRIINNGNISIATTTDFGYKLNLNGQPGANGYTAWTNWSDSRLKENVTDLDATNVLDRISKIRPVTYNYNELSGFDEATRSRRISGFIAQELMEVFPDMVGTITKEDGGEYYDTNLSNLDLYLVKAIQELYKKLQRNNIN